MAPTELPLNLRCAATLSSLFPSLLLLTCLFSFFGFSPPADAATEINPSIELGLQSYQRGQESEDQDLRLVEFNKAMQYFENAANSGITSAELFANIGTSALQAERIGPAVLAYRRALLLDPDLKIARQNLIHLRNQLPGWIARPEPAVYDQLFFWEGVWSTDERLGVAALAFFVACLLTATTIRWSSAPLRLLILLPAILWAGLISSVFFDPWGREGNDAVILQNDTVARAADSMNAPARFASPLPEGTELVVLERREHWSRIVFGDGLDAWIANSAYALVNPDT